MYYQIFGKPVSPEAVGYRGVYRLPAPYREDLPEASRYNRAWRRDASEFDSKLPDPALALAIANDLDPDGTLLDVIGVQEISEPLRVTGTDLGFDVAVAGHYSLLGDWLQSTYPLPSDDPCCVLMRLIRDCFREKLNENGLFADVATAVWFQTVTLALDHFIPQVWESQYEPKVLRIESLRRVGAG